MSFIRPLEKRRFSKGRSLYVYPTRDPNTRKDALCFNCVDYVDSEDFVEVMCRILEEAGISLTLEEVNRVRDRLFLPPIDRIVSLEEALEAYFPRGELENLEGAKKHLNTPSDKD